MKTIQLGHSGLTCQAIGLGTWAMGGWMWGGSDDAAAIDAICASLDAGIRLIDTAPAYGLGHAERLLGKALKGRRHQAIVATKCGLVWHTREGTHFFDEAGVPVYRHLARASIFHEVEQSLMRLQTDYIDLYITHWQDATTPVTETMGALLDLRAQGKIRAIGVSNVSPETLREYLECGPVDAIQERYSLIDREIESTLLPICTEHEIAVLGYSSLAMGLLAGPMDPARQFTGDDQRAGNPRFSAGNRAKLGAFFQEIEPLRERLGCTFAQLMIAWTVAHGAVSVALCGARTPQQALQNAGAATVALTDADQALVDGAAQRHLGPLFAPCSL
ncbi:aldo/keto reductase [Verminephrobacter aporrectodeae subsp. tuberculatae]|uniref:aldo/keto reductase n=1 Tax=Verminephrobacter aporrectodeae TaxID=1110389 RepID=UPI00223730D4|nr:aldo/keto reductase [Verminephrobacter aporrectodeae]MCW5221356.1 aldo/keto reductase [Verminephrobacter aporrectodeae subsp. tuberculatae]MCW5290647.1 aldo/keto reductase [Verminephrobacter aporrectodeae subsp. tuberculatae]